MGCGRGYLTFATHHYFSNILEFRDVRTVGVELRGALVRESNGIARSLGDSFAGLSFVQGTIEEACLFNEHDIGDGSDGGDEEAVEVLIALHACDTATDDALWSGVNRGADVIVVAPCCHKEVRPQIDAFFSSSPSSSLSSSSSSSTLNLAHADSPLVASLQHGIFRERSAEMVTDSIRAVLLEMAGYDVKVFEFISGEHTAKNIMLTAVRRSPRTRVVGKAGRRNQSTEEELLRDEVGEVKDAELRSMLRTRLRKLSEIYGVRHQRLADLMGEQISEDPRGLTGMRKSGTSHGEGGIEDRSPKDARSRGRRMPSSTE